MFGNSALDLAEENGHVQLVQYFKKEGKKHKGKDGEKCTIC